MFKSLFIGAFTLATCGFCNAASLYVTATGAFSSSDTADSYATPGDTFSLSFVVNSAPAIAASSATTVSFDVPVVQFSYRLNGASVAGPQPSEITFYTAADGGGYAVNFPSAQFLFGSAQLFSGSTTTPSFATGSYSGQTFTFLDSANADSGSAAVAITNTPEPSSFPLLLCGSIGLLAIGIKTSVRVR